MLNKDFCVFASVAIALSTLNAEMLMNWNMRLLLKCWLLEQLFATMGIIPANSERGLSKGEKAMQIMALPTF